MTSKKNYMTLGEKIKDLRIKNFYTQRELAHLLCIGEGYLSKIENNKKLLRRIQIPDLAKFLETPRKELEILWLATKIYMMLKDEKYALDALKRAEIELTVDEMIKSDSNKSNQT